MKTSVAFRQYFPAVVLLCGTCLPCAARAGEAADRAKRLGIPSLDEMAGAWMPMDEIINPPSLHNGHNMLIVDRDLTSYFFSPGGWLYNLPAYGDAKEPTLWKRGHPAVKLKLDGVEYPARECRWFGYRSLRRNNYCNGIAVETDSRLLDETRGVLCRIAFTNTTLLPRKFRASLSISGSLQPDRVGVANTFQRAGAITVVRPTRRPDSVDIDAYIVATWNYDLDLAPGQSIVLGFAAGDESVPVAGTDGFVQGDIGNQKSAALDSRVAGWAKEFDAAFASCREAREARWADAFTPGNRHFSGHLPVLTTEDVALNRNYYMGVLGLLCVERTQFRVHPRSFITNGERDDGTQFYFDLSVLPTTWALLEPEGMKATLRRWLVQSVRNGAWLDIRQPNGYDAKVYDHMQGYAYNAWSFLYAADVYLRVTGDLPFLDEKLENGKTVFENMDAAATDWELLPKVPGGLSDFGGNECLLECAPTYTHGVASMNAQGVWLLRTMAAWHEQRGNAEKARSMRARADAFVPKVLQLYKPSDGVWYSLQPDGRKSELRHCMDYIFVGSALHKDLSETQRKEMNRFVRRELMTRDWMRAMSRKDDSSPLTQRTDHGPTGSYDVWLPMTVATMWRLGDPRAAYDLYTRAAIVTREGPFTQAHEFFGPARDTFDGSVRISEDRGCMRESDGGATFAEVVLATFFGFCPNMTGSEVLADAATARPFSGELKNLFFRGKELTLSAGKHGAWLVGGK
jgi:hypothetical protein